MAKLKLSKSQAKAVKDSIAHWKKDIQAKLKRGIKIHWTVWADDGEAVPCYADNCPLCQIYYKIDNLPRCKDCPYFKKYEDSCVRKDWRAFIRKPCLETCDGMIKALENILK